MVTRTFVTILASALILIGVAAPAAAQNGYSFSDAARSATAYSRATVRPQMACRDLLGMTDPDMSIVSAEIIPAADGVPEHCRVNGLLVPEIRFQVNLPAYWNRRFYMNGNGGFAGESPEAPNRAALRATALRHGFVSATTNTGHDAAQEPLATFAERNYQKVVDYAFRAVHLTAVTVEDARHALLRPHGDLFVLGRLLHRRPAGAHGSAALPGRLRRRGGRRARAELHRHADTRALARAALEGAGVTLDTLKIVADRVYAKCDGSRRPGGRHHRRPAALPLRSREGPAHLRGRSERSDLRDDRPGRGAEEDVRRRRQQWRAVLPRSAGRCGEDRDPALRVAAGRQRLGPLARGGGRHQAAAAGLSRVVHEVHRVRQGWTRAGTGRPSTSTRTPPGWPTRAGCSTRPIPISASSAAAAASC